MLTQGKLLLLLYRPEQTSCSECWGLMSLRWIRSTADVPYFVAIGGVTLNKSVPSLILRTWWLTHE